MIGVVQLLANGLLAVGTVLHDRTKGFSDRGAEKCAARAGETHLGPGAGRDTSRLITAAANQLQCWLDGQSMHAMRRDYLDELLDEMRDRAAQFTAIKD